MPFISRENGSNFVDWVAMETSILTQHQKILKIYFTIYHATFSKCWHSGPNGCQYILKFDTFFDENSARVKIFPPFRNEIHTETPESGTKIEKNLSYLTNWKELFLQVINIYDFSEDVLENLASNTSLLWRVWGMKQRRR